MTYEIYRYIFICGAVLACVFAATAVLLFFLLKIPRVFGDLTGSTARKAIAEIRSQNETTGNKVYKTSPVNRNRGKLTDKISASGKLFGANDHGDGGGMATEKISTDRLLETAPLPSGDETTLLSEPAGETELLVTPQQMFEIEYEITFVHTEEVIV